jgi:hypothetical protein
MEFYTQVGSSRRRGVPIKGGVEGVPQFELPFRLESRAA